MTRPGLLLWLVVWASVSALPAAAQSQSCPLNINFSSGTFLHWEAYTGNNKAGNGPTAILQTYDSLTAFPNGTINALALPEYDLNSTTGLQVITTRSTDPFGNFPTIPTINGYNYRYSILLGSTAVSVHPTNDNMGQPGGVPAANTPQGGYVRGVSYLIDVPPGPPSVPYTMTYAYAMVLENGTHASQEQPMARAIISTPGGVITCASPAYFLPTNGGQLDSSTAYANGFSPSPLPTPNVSPNANGQHLRDVWTKGWTEVTFDLSPYRGSQVSLTFEADNCVPGGHFAYAYFALRDVCAGLQISGDTVTCGNSIEKYSIPSLDSASYDWSAPPGWLIGADNNENTITVKVGTQPGWIVAKEKTSCAILTDSLYVDLYPGNLPQATVDPPDTTVCYGQNAPLAAAITTGTGYTWTASGAFTGAAKDTVLSLPLTANIIATPDQTAQYILELHNAGCPIAVSDTITVTIVQPIKVFPGNDTLVVLDEPLHFQATSSDPFPDNYQWSPSTDLSNPDIANPTGIYGSDVTNITYEVTATDAYGCSGTASVQVIVAHTLPDIFVPNAFTPGKESNGIFRPVCFGISSLDFFRVYNRWGQLLYSTSEMGQGWNGRIQGILQEPNAYLWVVKGIDYTGRPIAKKGTVILIR